MGHRVPWGLRGIEWDFHVLGSARCRSCGSGPACGLRRSRQRWAASAATFAVTNTNDAGEGSLRAAITQANARDGADTIDASGVSGTIELWSALPELTDPVELVGPGPERLTVRRTDDVPLLNFRIFNFNRAQEARISGFTLRTGATSGGGGGAISSVNTKLHARDLHLTENAATTGGAVYVNGGEVLIEESLITGNRATFGGGVSVANGGALTLARSAVVTNTAVEAGAGVLVAAGDNDVTARGSTIASNTVLSADPQDPGGGGIGALDGARGTILVESSTIANNSAPVGSALQVGESPTTVRSSIITGACAQEVSSLGYNLATDAPCGLDQPTDQTGVNPLLGPLADNGGPTPTMLPRPGSPAIDKGFAGDLGADQRGLPRVDFKAIGNAAGGDGADVGAAEVQDETAPALNAKRPKVNRKQRSVKLRFKAKDDATGKLTFRCKLDRKKFKRCKSPVAYKRLKPGKHRITVRAIDAAGNRAQAAKRFRVPKRER